MSPLLFHLDEARNGLHPPVTAPADSRAGQLGEVGGRGSAGGPAGDAAPAEGSGPNPGTGVQPSGEQNKQVGQERKCTAKG